jgi:hypothetical protein
MWSLSILFNVIEVVDSNSAQHNILNDQTEVMEELSELYSPASRHKTVVLKIGNRLTTVYPFHYPPHSFAFTVKWHHSKVLSFIDKYDNQLLRKWTIKAALLVTIKSVSQKLFAYYTILL